MNWDKPIITDSGGFQVMTLIHKGKTHGKLTDNEVIFVDSSGKRINFTPELSIETQLKLGSDVLICLDDCTDPQAPSAIQEKSVERTVNWARRCKIRFDELTKNASQKPLLFAVVQGGKEKPLRTGCAKELIKIGFDGYCFGGRPVDSNKDFLKEIIDFTAKLLPDDKPKYAMGVGKPADIVYSYLKGYDMFDCVIPTREARHKRLYLFNKTPKNIKDLEGNFYSTISLTQSKYKDKLQPISEFCDCLTCKNFTLAYLYHLFKIKDTLALRLATIHNLRFYTQLIEALRHKSRLL